jgi:Ca-activated chloride channel family protein
VPRGDRDQLEFRVATAAGDEVAAQRLELGKETDQRAALKALFGARRVLGLEYLINSGYSMDELGEQLGRLQYDADKVLGEEIVPSKVYAENVREDAQRALRSLLVREALEYGLASAETAFVAVRTEAGQPIEGTIPVASALPVGWSDSFLAPLLAARPRSGTSRVLPQAVPPITPRLPTHFMAKAASSVADVGAGQRLAAMGPVVGEPSGTPEPVVLYSGVPQFEDGVALLFDSAREEDSGKVSSAATIREIRVRFPDGEPDSVALDAGLRLLIFVGDVVSPRAEMDLADVVRRRGRRPLNLARAKGDVLRIVLVDPQGTWREGAPQVEVALAWDSR